MREISEALRRRLETNTTLLAKATLRLADGTVRELAGDDLVALSCEQATTSSGSFDVGAAIIGSLSVTLNNHDERFATYDFEGAELTAHVGADLGGTVEWLRLGTYAVDQPEAFSGTIALSGLDGMSLLEAGYEKVRTRYPATLAAIVSDACSACGLPLATKTFPNSGYSVARRPGGEDTTCLEVVAAAAQVAGCYAKVDDAGALHIAWYDREGFGGEDWLDGEAFDDASPYASGDDADGGTFDYDLGYVADGGTFETSGNWAHVHSYTSLKVNTDDVRVTGVQVTAQNQVVLNDQGEEENGEDGETALSGSDGYVIRVEDNPLVCYGQAAAVARQIASQVVGMEFRPFTATMVANPEIEAGDCVVVSDARGNSYHSFATTVALKANGAMTVTCDAQTKSRAAVIKRSEAQKAEDSAREDLKREETAREAQGAKFQVLAGEIRAEVEDKASKSELRQTADAIESTVAEKVATAKSEAISSANSYTSTTVRQTARDLTVEINSAKSQASDAQDTADEAKSVTDKFIFSSSGLQIQGAGTSGRQQVATYTQSGFNVTAETVDLGTSAGKFTVKDWGLYFEGNNGCRLWLTDGERYGGGYHFYCCGVGYDFKVDTTGAYWNGQRLAVESSGT